MFVERQTKDWPGSAGAAYQADIRDSYGVSANSHYFIYYKHVAPPLQVSAVLIIPLMLIAVIIIFGFRVVTINLLIPYHDTRLSKSNVAFTSVFK